MSKRWKLPKLDWRSDLKYHLSWCPLSLDFKVYHLSPDENGQKQTLNEGQSSPNNGVLGGWEKRNYLPNRATYLLPMVPKTLLTGSSYFVFLRKSDF